MSFREMIEILDAEVLVGSQHLECELKHAFAANSLSEVLSFSPEGALLITGLTNIQVVRIAELLDLSGIVFVGRKRPDEMACKLAQIKNIPLFSTSYVMFEACGRLFKNGLCGSIQKVKNSNATLQSPLADTWTSVNVV
jgi:predicted transcriptional regulator